MIYTVIVFFYMTMMIHWKQIRLAPTDFTLPAFLGRYLAPIKTKGWSPSLKIPFVVVVCDINITGVNYKKDEIYYDMRRQLNQFRTMLGSLLYFSSSYKWRVVVITDHQSTFDNLVKSLTKWPKKQLERLQLERRALFMPKDKNISGLMKHYRPCAWQKVFLDQALPDEEAIVYVDSDILFTGPAEGLWKVFDNLGQSRALGLGPEPLYLAEDDRNFAGKAGLNTGVIVMNLTKLKTIFPNPRNFGYHIAKEMREASLNPVPPRHEQDVINQFLSRRKHLFYEFPYKWNFMPSDCTFYKPLCPDCFEDGISVVHGAESTFYRNVERKFVVNFVLFFVFKFKLSFCSYRLVTY